MGLMDRIHPAPKNGGFSDPDWWIWCGSVVRGEDGRFHIFASRWSKRLPYHHHWLFNCEVVPAVAERAEGPYRFEEVVLPRRGAGFFDGMNTHNPSIRFHDGMYYLYYMGTTYQGAPPTGEVAAARALEVWNTKRIGLAVSRSVFGPWRRMDQPLLSPRPGRWDATATTNPSATILADGQTYMIYKSRAFDGATLQLGMARAQRPDGPFERLCDEPILRFNNPDFHVEDPFLWHDARDNLFHLLVKDDFKNDCGGVTGEWGAGIHATSADAVHWTLDDPAKAYSRTVVWDDGTVTVQPNLERPSLLFDETGTPTHLFCATGAGPGIWNFDHTWNMCFPLRT